MKRRLQDSYNIHSQADGQQDIKPEITTLKNITHRSTNYPPCQVCGDRSSGLHYGVITCNGCRSFFRRAIGGRKHYECEYGEDCVVDVRARAQCKACRLKKSLEVGMRADEVVMFSSKLTSKVSDPEEEDDSPDMALIPIDNHSFTVSHLLWNYRNNESQLDLQFAPYLPKENLRFPSGVQDMYDAVQTELHYLVGWAKFVDVFNRLEAKSKVALLRTHCTEFLYLEAARRSMDLVDHFVGANGFKIVRIKEKVPDGFVFKMSCPFRELMDPCRTLRISEEEFLCLKALVLFNPYTNGLAEKDAVKVGLFQQQVRTMLENIAERRRMINLLLILPSLSKIAEELRGSLRSYKVNGFTTTYKLLDELVLDEINRTCATE